MSVADKVQAGLLHWTGQLVAKTVAKASSHEILGPKRKHVEALIALTENPSQSMSAIGDELFSRSLNSSWIVVFKALITCHNLMVRGNERFQQYLASRTPLFSLDNFLDRGNVQARDMSTFIRRYAVYLNQKALSYRQMGYDFCRIKRGKEDGVLRSFDSAKLFKALPSLENLLDALLAMDVTSCELSNGVINAAFLVMFKDLIKLFACYNDAMINLLEKFYELKKTQCREAVSSYRKFLGRMDRVSELIKVAEEVGIDRDDMPTLTKPPTSLLDSLEEHTRALEKGTKVNSSQSSQVLMRAHLESSVAAPTQPVTHQPPAPAPTVAAVTVTTDGQSRLTAEEIAAKKRELEQERARLLALREQHQRQQQPAAVAANTSATSDLSELSSVFSSPPQQPLQQSMPILPGQQTFDPFGNATNAFGGSSGFEAKFGQPVPSSNSVMAPPLAAATALGDLLEPERTGQFMPSTSIESQKKRLGGNLSTGLNQAIEDLDLSRSTTGVMQKTQHQWKEPNKQKTGGAHWAPLLSQSMTVQQQQQSGNHSADWNSPYASQPHAQMRPSAQPMYNTMQPGMGMGMGMGMQQPQSGMGMGMGMQPGMGMGMGMQQPGMGMGMRQPGVGMGMGMRPAAGMGMGMQPFGQQPQPRPTQPSDPFGPI